MTQEQFEALGIEKSLAKKAADASAKELEGYVSKETYDTTEAQKLITGAEDDEQAGESQIPTTI